jgi:hydroxypyruvate isomerase
MVAGASLATGASALTSAEGIMSTPQAQQRKFKLNYAPHPGMFRQHANGGDVVAEIDFMASEGFTALEYNGLKDRPVPEQEAIGKALERNRMKMGVFVAHTIDWNETGLPGGRAEKIDRFLQEVTASVDVAKRVNAKWMTVVPGRVDERRDMAFQTATVIETLKRASAILEPHGLVMVLEMLNTRVNHPGQFLTHTAQGYAICKGVGSPACKLLYDMYHQQITEGHLIRNLDMAYDEIGYMQVGDNPGRNEPGTGEINYRNVFKHIHSKGFTGIIGMEHGNSIRGARNLPDAERFAIDKRGERAVIDSYIAADNFTTT